MVKSVPNHRARSAELLQVIPPLELCQRNIHINKKSVRTTGEAERERGGNINRFFQSITRRGSQEVTHTIG